MPCAGGGERSQNRTMEVRGGRRWHDVTTLGSLPSPSTGAGPPEWLRHLLAPAQPVIRQLLDLLGFVAARSCCSPMSFARLKSCAPEDPDWSCPRRAADLPSSSPASTDLCVWPCARTAANTRRRAERPDVASQIRQKIDAIELPFGLALDARGRERCRSTSSWMIGRESIFLPEAALPANHERHADAALPCLTLGSAQRRVGRSVDRRPGHRRAAVVAEEEDQRVLLQAFGAERGRVRPMPSSMADIIAA